MMTNDKPATGRRHILLVVLAAVLLPSALILIGGTGHPGFAEPQENAAVR